MITLNLDLIIVVRAKCVTTQSYVLKNCIIISVRISYYGKKKKINEENKCK